MHHMTASPADGATPHAVRSDCEILVVGGGIIGTATALELQAAGHDVHLVDARGVGEACSFGNAGHIAVEHIFPLATPSLLAQLPALFFEKNGPLSLRWSYLPRLAPWLVRFLWAARPAQVTRGLKAISTLNGKALESYRLLEERFGLDGLLKEEGTIAVYQNERLLEATGRERNTLAEHGISTALLDQTALRAFDPQLSKNLAGGVLYPGSAHVGDPQRLVKTLFEHFKQAGGSFAVSRVTDILPEKHFTLVETNVGTIRCKKLVIAAGAWSHQLTDLLGYKTPLETERGYHLTLTGASISPRVPTTFADRKFVATPMEMGLRIAGRVELGGLKLPMKHAQADALLPLAEELLPGLQVTGMDPWMGFRPTLPDSLPVISTAPKHKDIYCAFGHNHMGLTHGAITGRLMRQLIQGKTTELDLTPYRLDRF